MANEDRIANALQGFGAGFRGRGSEFLSGLRQEKQQVSAERKQAMLIDNRLMRDHLKSGRIPQARDLLLNRVQNLQQLKADPSDTLDQLGFLEPDESGNPRDLQRAIQEAQEIDDRAVLEGLLPAPARGADFTLSPGQTRFSSRGEVIAEGSAQEKDSLEQLKFNLQKSKDRFSKAQALRSEIDTLSKDFLKVEDAFDRIKNSVSDPSPAGDLALIFNFMRMLDPSSVVRESEFRTAADARAWLSETEESGTKIPTFVKQAIQKFEVGTFLTPEQRKDFSSRAKKLFSGTSRIHDKRVNARLSVGEQFGIKKSLILGAPPATGTTIRFDEQGNPIQ